MSEKLNAKSTETRGCLWETEFQRDHHSEVADGAVAMHALGGKEMKQMRLWLA